MAWNVWVVHAVAIIRRAQERHSHDGFVTAPGTENDYFLRDDNTWQPVVSGDGGSSFNAMYAGAGGGGIGLHANFTNGSTSTRLEPETVTGTALGKRMYAERYWASGGVGWRGYSTNGGYAGRDIGVAWRFTFGVTAWGSATNRSVFLGVSENTGPGLYTGTDLTSSCTEGFAGITTSLGADRLKFACHVNSTGATSTDDTGIDLVAGAVYAFEYWIGAGESTGNFRLLRLDTNTEATWTSTDIPVGATSWNAIGYATSAYSRLALVRVQAAWDYLGAI